LDRHGTSALEYKLDGARVQVHRVGGDVRVFSRRLHDVTASVPELVAAALSLPVREVLLDGEALVLRADGRPEAFQTTMRRFGRRLDVAAMAAELPLSVFFFDCLRVDGEDLLDRPGEERFAALAGAVAPESLVPRLVTTDVAAAEGFFERAIAAGHEGVMAKQPAATYEAGSRGRSWLKIKRAHTLDLVVLAAEWGHGRRRGKLSNLHLGARAAGGFVMLGKTFKGLTDAMLEEQTRRLLELETSREGRVVHVAPRLVVEVAFDGVQESPQYPGGLALRFARVRGYRLDKSAAEADSFEAVQAIWAGQG
ncbi:MAG: ATP-dependent DNA ligase, partial [Thermoanaerobaculia bacterium]|nr:ATP-dependent DNA ligase [Thermoanaerobaculia bacterium]